MVELKAVESNCIAFHIIHIDSYIKLGARGREIIIKNRTWFHLVFSFTHMDRVHVCQNAIIAELVIFKAFLFGLSIWLWMFLSLASQKSQGECTIPQAVMLMMPNVIGLCSLDQRSLMVNILWVLGRAVFGISSSRYDTMISVTYHF